jgi:hypothetical protein
LCPEAADTTIGRDHHDVIAGSSAGAITQKASRAASCWQWKHFLHLGGAGRWGAAGSAPLKGEGWPDGCSAVPHRLGTTCTNAIAGHAQPHQATSDGSAASTFAETDRDHAGPLVLVGADRPDECGADTAGR